MKINFLARFTSAPGQDLKQNEIAYLVIAMSYSSKGQTIAQVGGGTRFVVGCNCSYLYKKTFFSGKRFFVFMKNEHVRFDGRPLYLSYSVCYYLLAYSGQHIFHQFLQQTSFLPRFSDFCGDELFFVFLLAIHLSPGI